MSDIDNIVLIVWIVWILALFAIAINLFKDIINMRHDEKFIGGIGMRAELDTNMNNFIRNMPADYPYDDDIDEPDSLIKRAIIALVTGARADREGHTNNNYTTSKFLPELKNKISSLFRNNDSNAIPHLYAVDGRDTEIKLVHRENIITLDKFQSMFDNCVKNLYGLRFMRRGTGPDGRRFNVNAAASAELLGGLFIEYHYACNTVNEDDQNFHYEEIRRYIMNMDDYFY